MNGEFDEVFADLTSQANGLWWQQYEAEVADFGVGEYARVSLFNRLTTEIGQEVRVVLPKLTVQGVLAELALEWVLIEDVSGGIWALNLAEVMYFQGISHQPSMPKAKPPRLVSWQFRFARLSQDSAQCQLHFRSGVTFNEVQIIQCGKDFISARIGQDGELTIPMNQLLALQFLN